MFFQKFSKLLNTLILFYAHAGGIRYYSRWRVVFMETAYFKFVIFWPSPKILTKNDFQKVPQELFFVKLS